jgi:hypothetical protein
MIFQGVISVVIWVAGFSFISQSVLAGSNQLGKSIYRLDNQRYEKFFTDKGAIFLLSTSFSYEEKLGSAICEQKTKSMKEVLKIKDNDTLSEDDKKNEGAIVALIGKCSSQKNTADDSAGGTDKNGVKIKISPTKEDGEKAEPGVSVQKNWP